MRLNEEKLLLEWWFVIASQGPGMLLTHIIKLIDAPQRKLTGQ
jgi:hypothetical protein